MCRASPGPSCKADTCLGLHHPYSISSTLPPHMQTPLPPFPTLPPEIVYPRLVLPLLQTLLLADLQPLPDRVLALLQC